MSWLRQFFGRDPILDQTQLQSLARYQSLPRMATDSPLMDLRFVVADVETTGLNPVSDRLISIGAVEVIAGNIRMGSAFEVVLRQSDASPDANILIHGIDGTTQLSGQDPAAAILQFFDYAAQAPLVGFHAGFDKVMIDRAAKSAVGTAPFNDWLDLARLAPALFPEQGLKDHALDLWLEKFGITNYARHNALADALSTAQLLQVVLAKAVAQGTGTLGDLIRIDQEQRWLTQLNR